MKKILLFKLDDVAYNSTRFFADVLGSELERLGARVDFFDIKEHTDISELEAYAEKQYDCIIDFNSKLPRLINEDNSYFMDDFHAPFYNYIVDHPMYHHKNLICPLKNYNVVCLDDMHKEYIKKYYTHIKNVIVKPLGAIKAEDIFKDTGVSIKKWSDRTHTLLFMGTYLDPESYMSVINGLPSDMKNNIKNVIDCMMAEPNATYEESLLKVAGDSSMCKSIGTAAFAQMMCLADIYVRAVFRRKVVEAYAETGISMTICGENYDKSGLSDRENVTILNQVDYRESFKLMQDAKYVLNVMPWFKSGIHDRVLNSMINGAVCVSDGSRMMDKYFKAGRDYIQYSIEDMSTINNIEALEEIRSKAEEISYNGKNIASDMTFAQIAKEIYAMI